MAKSLKPSLHHHQRHLNLDASSAALPASCCCKRLILFQKSAAHFALPATSAAVSPLELAQRLSKKLPMWPKRADARVCCAAFGGGGVALLAIYHPFITLPTSLLSTAAAVGVVRHNRHTKGVIGTGANSGRCGSSISKALQQEVLRTSSSGMLASGCM